MFFPIMNSTTDSIAKISTKVLISAFQPIQRTTVSPTAMIMKGIHKRRLSPRPKNKRRSIMVKKITKAKIFMHSAQAIR